MKLITKVLDKYYCDKLCKEMVCKIMDTLVSFGFDSSKLLAINIKEVYNV